MCCLRYLCGALPGKSHPAGPAEYYDRAMYRLLTVCFRLSAARKRHSGGGETTSGRFPAGDSVRTQTAGAFLVTLQIYSRASGGQTAEMIVKPLFRKSSRYRGFSIKGFSLYLQKQNRRKPYLTCSLYRKQRKNGTVTMGGAFVCRKKERRRQRKRSGWGLYCQRAGFNRKRKKNL